MFLHFCHRGLVDQRTLEYSWFEAVTYFKFFYRDDQFMSEVIINASLDVKSIGANAGLTCIAVFGNDRAFDCSIQIGIVENDKGRIASELQRKLFDGVSALFHEQATHLSRTCKGHFAHVRVG